MAPIHIEAKKGEVADVVLLVGNPERAKFIAENYLTDVKQNNEYRLMYGYTGFYKDKRVSVQTSGMGIASLSIIVEELNMLGVKTIIRMGTSGAINDAVNLNDIVITNGAHCSHPVFAGRFSGGAYSAVSDFRLTAALADRAALLDKNIHVGNILTAEFFYEESFDQYKQFAGYNSLVVEMEAYPLFTLASKYGIKAATVLAVTDIVFEQKRAPKDEIKETVKAMTGMVLDTIVEKYDYLTE